MWKEFQVQELLLLFFLFLFNVQFFSHFYFDRFKLYFYKNFIYILNKNVSSYLLILVELDVILLLFFLFLFIFCYLELELYPLLAQYQNVHILSSMFWDLCFFILFGTVFLLLYKRIERVILWASKPKQPKYTKNYNSFYPWGNIY